MNEITNQEELIPPISPQDAEELMRKMKERLQANNATAKDGVIPFTPIPFSAPINDVPINELPKVDQAEQSKSLLTPPFIKPQAVQDAWLNHLPTMAVDEFLIEAQWENERALCCVRELEWVAAMDIEAASFRQSAHDQMYFSGEYEKRETLKKAILWIVDIQSKQLLENKNGDILTYLKQGVVENLWTQYSAQTSLDASEANALYTAAKMYFSGKAQQGYPVPSLIKEVDLYHKHIASLTRTELRQIKASDMERINLITMAREEALFLNKNTAPSHQSMTKHEDVTSSENVVLTDNFLTPKENIHSSQKDESQSDIFQMAQMWPPERRGIMKQFGEKNKEV